jgi:hypothetical protein
VKAYLVITGAIFGLIGGLHAWRSIAEISFLSSDPWYFLGMSALGVVAAALSVWAWLLLVLLSRESRGGDERKKGS